MREDDFIVSKTDLQGRITYVNKIFMDMSEYSEDELLGKPHNFIRHLEMPKGIFKLLWEMIKNKDEIFAFVLNKTKNSNAYWVYANVTPSLDENGRVIGYYSVRRQPNEKALEIIKPLYAQMLKAEQNGGIDASIKILTNLLKEKGVSYNEFIISIEK
jgi:PAS domain S-box-containing protein